MTLLAIPANRLLTAVAKSRLAEWTQEAMKVAGSSRQLASLLGVTHTAVLKWANQRLTEWPKEETLMAIAQLRGENYEATIQWLTIDNQKEELLTLLLNASPETLLLALETISTRLKYFYGSIDCLSTQEKIDYSLSEDNDRMASTYNFFAERLREAGFNPNTEDSWRQFASLTSLITYERLREILNGAEIEDWEYGELAVGLQSILEDGRWNQITLKSALAEEHNHHCRADSH